MEEELKILSPGFCAWQKVKFKSKNSKFKSNSRFIASKILKQNQVLFFVYSQNQTMKKINLHSEIHECSEKELSSSDKKLLSEAKKSAVNAYAPYSKFKVGSAVLLENGKIISGNNQENAAYPSGLCAERVALFFSSSQYPNEKIKAIAITHVPCGACRQAILEYETKQKSPVRIIIQKEKNKILIAQEISHLLPLAFVASILKRKR
ncbi:MAG: cytidine deaminase [Bacteroidetes bacterium]|nr:cytidine deaminase [Bacteroidota bacterium]